MNRKSAEDTQGCAYSGELPPPGGLTCGHDESAPIHNPHDHRNFHHAFVSPRSGTVATDGLAHLAKLTQDPGVFEPTDDDIAESDTIATVFIKVRMEQLRGELEACNHGKPPRPCIYCFSRTERLGELENLL